MNKNPSPVCKDRAYLFFWGYRMCDCRYFDGCSAPMCPKDNNVKQRTWFPDEDICSLKDVPEWVKRQRKIAKKAVGFEAGYFTLAMLIRNCFIAKGIKGLDPDKPEKDREKDENQWLEKHPIKKAVSENEREKRASRMRSIRSKVIDSGGKKAANS